MPLDFEGYTSLGAGSRRKGVVSTALRPGIRGATFKVFLEWQRAAGLPANIRYASQPYHLLLAAGHACAAPPRRCGAAARGASSRQPAPHARSACCASVPSAAGDHPSSCSVASREVGGGRSSGELGRGRRSGSSLKAGGGLEAGRGLEAAGLVAAGRKNGGQGGLFSLGGVAAAAKGRVAATGGRTMFTARCSPRVPTLPWQGAGLARVRGHAKRSAPGPLSCSPACRTAPHPYSSKAASVPGSACAAPKVASYSAAAGASSSASFASSAGAGQRGSNGGCGAAVR